ncbi:MAG TPA: anti-sigma factor [Bacillus bacterium]|uniref:Anti-sigma-W factor RsiW n=1 Tax=Siminovitchia fordii TaxID=254759 RepID=A0ABQ4K612_9BACI|nr:zf-HC2 domain-containing protein [Siminovitchia fordii]GIN20625.1 anti-sigma-W factor RsiW [Siminovitchia fordii]HBZ08636.1 anti-sigma factor [Bacillus sp. (in: firmicutes)]
MKACSEEIVLYMQEYMDGDLTQDKERVLKEHLQKCQDCQSHFQELKRTEALVKSVSRIAAPAHFTNQVMARLPKEKNIVGVRRWFRHHPMLIAVSVFFVLMAGSLVSGWNDDQKFAFTKKPNIIVENDTVIVPEGEVVDGDLVVKNGNIRIEGQVDGNVTIINGDKYMASAGNVTGNIDEIDEMFEWIWYKMKEGGKKIGQLFK